MLITREVDYGIRIVRNLSVDEYKSIVDIAEKEHITKTIAHKLARILNKEGIIKSKRGIDGGYALNISLDELRLYDIYVALIDKPAINECLLDSYICPINKEKGCGVHQELRRIQNILFDEFKRTPISKMID